MFAAYALFVLAILWLVVLLSNNQVRAMMAVIALLATFCIFALPIW